VQKEKKEGGNNEQDEMLLVTKLWNGWRENENIWLLLNLINI
jgi:hypothetical protein